MNIELTVAYVGFGGNIGDGEYFYSYSPNTVCDGRSLTLSDSNSHPQLTMLAIIVLDTARNKKISCDPQILNVPD